MHGCMILATKFSTWVPECESIDRATVGPTDADGPRVVPATASSRMLPTADEGKEEGGDIQVLRVGPAELGDASWDRCGDMGDKVVAHA